MHQFNLLLSRAIMIFFIIALFSTTKSLAQGNVCTAAADLGTLSYHLNQNSNLGAALTYSTSVSTNNFSNPPQCVGTSIVPTGTSKDGWYRFTAANTIQMVIQYTSTFTGVDQDDAILEVYRLNGASCSNDLQLLGCSNNSQNAPGTESVNISAVAGTEYYIRVISTEAEITGFLSVYESAIGAPNGDICSEAVEVSVGTCDFPFFIQDDFFNHEGRSDCGGFTAINVDPTINIQGDGWLVFEATEDIRVGVSYQNTTGQSFGIEVYTGTCGNLTAVGGGCTTDNDKEFDVTSGSTYYVRVMNYSDNSEMQGFVCIYESFYRDDCADLLNAGTPVSPLSIGDCNVRVNIPLANTSTTLGTSCLTEAQPDSWVVFTSGSGIAPNTPIRLDFAVSTSLNAGIAVYEQTTCPTNSLNEIACTASGGAASISFDASPNTTYFIRFLNPTLPPAPAPEDVFASLCIYEDTKKAEDNFYTANTFLIDGTDCGRQFNALSSFSNSNQESTINQGGYPFPNSLASSTDLSCSPSDAQLDAWVRFQVTGSPLANGLVIEYNNDNNDPSVANNVAMLVYRTNLNAATPAPADAAAFSAAPVVVADTPYTGFDVSSIYGTGDGDPALPAVFEAFGPNVALNRERWIQYVHTGAGTFTVVFEEDVVDNSNLYLYNATPTLGSELALSKAQNVTEQALTFSGAGTYYIRVVSDVPTTGGQLTIYTEFTLVDCIDAEINTSPYSGIGAGEGIERITLPNTLANGDYFIRVANTDAASSTLGTLCIRPDVTVDGDICSSAVSLIEGDCDIDFSLTTNLTDTPIINNDPVAMCGFDPGADINRDGWIKFIATSSRTTIQYFSPNEDGTNVDVALAGYRGSCGSLIYLNACANDEVFGSIDDRVETLKLNTIVGLEYYVRIMQVGSSLGNIEGRICIFNTTERDVCDDDDLITRYVGDCNITFDIPASFTNTGANLRNFLAAEGGLPLSQNNGSLSQIILSSCETEGATFTDTDTNPTLTGSAKDGWMRFIGNGSEITITYESSSEDSDPVLMVYTALQGQGPVNCGVGINGAGNPNNQFACANNTGIIPASNTRTESVAFQTNSGQNYIIRIIDLAGQGMEGKLCIADGGSDYNDPCSAREVSLGDCSVPLNVVVGINDCFAPSTNPTPNYEDGVGGNCDDCPGADAWAKFTTPYVCDADLYDNATTAGDGTPDFRNVNYTINASNECLVGGNPAPWLERHDGLDNTPGTADDYCSCANETIPPEDFYRYVTIEYNNNDGLFSDGVDARVLVYQIQNAGNDVDPDNNTNGNCEVGELGDDGSNYTKVGYDLNGDGTPDGTCLDATAGEGLEQFLNIDAYGATVDDGEGGDTYYIRIISEDNTQSLFGNLCLFYGEDIGGNNCAASENYGDLEGEFKSLTIPGGSSEISASQTPQATIPNCVLAGGSNPRSANPPVRSDSWIYFDVPVDPSNPGNPLYTAVTVQYATVNSQGQALEANPQNAAIAVYGPDTCPTDGTTLLGCSNTVFVGTESLTFSVPGTGRYYVRIMNVHFDNGNPRELLGRVRVFPFAECEEGPELVVDGDFAMWPARLESAQELATMTGTDETLWGSTAAGTGGNGRVYTYGNSTPTVTDYTRSPATATSGVEFDRLHHNDIQIMARVPNNDPYPTDIDENQNTINGVNINTGISRFASDFGYISDYRSNHVSITYNGGTGNAIATDARRIASYERDIQRNRFYSQGAYTVQHSPTTLYEGWNAFDLLYSGWGKGRWGRYRANYCATGAGVGEAGCTSVSLGGIVTDGEYNLTLNRPRNFPLNQAANMMIVDGSYNPNRTLNPGKIWCQTIFRSGGTVGYYVFTLWTNNIDQRENNTEVPQLRITICDMEDPNNPGNFPTLVGSFDPATTPPEDIDGDANDDGTPDGAPDGIVDGTRLPGVTVLSDNLTLPPQGNLEEPVIHYPLPPNQRTRAFGQTPTFGAAEYCNRDNESTNARIKVLGSSFFIEERPDGWQLLRCIYRAPADVSEFNVCIENLSLSIHGNDFAIDKLSMRECQNPNEAAFDRMLKGDPCELADDPSALGIPLTANLLDFTGVLIGQNVFLDWLTLQEHNSAHFEVQRSRNGIDFTKIGQVDARGQGASYQFIDYNLPADVRNLYYRLKIVDKNGLSSFGPVIEIDVSGRQDFEVKIIPNPQVQGNSVDLQFNVQSGKVGIEIVDLMGNSLLRNIIDSQEGVNRYTLSTSSLQPGIYLIRIAQAGRIVTKKLMVL